MIDDDRKNASTANDPEREALEAAWRRMPADEPPELLDQAILNRARRDLETARPRRLRWLGPFATAGVALIALSVWLLSDRGPASPGGDGALRLEPATERALPAAPDALRAREAADAPLREEAAEAQEFRPVTRAKSAAASPAPRPAPSAMLQVAPTEEAAPATDETGDQPPGAAEWVERMLALAAAGRTNELAAELAAFRAAYPDYPLPPALRDD